MSASGPSANRPPCTHCTSTRVVRIVYGTRTPALEEAIEAEEAWWGSQEYEEGDFEWHCFECHGDF